MNIFKRQRVVPIECVEELLKIKGSSIEEMRTICQGKALKLNERATDLIQLGKGKRESAKEKFDSIVSKARAELNKAFEEANADEKEASNNIVESQWLEKIIATIS